MASERRERGHPTKSLRGAERRGNLIRLISSDRHVASRHAPLAASTHSRDDTFIIAFILISVLLNSRGY